MLAGLTIRNIVLIEKLELNFERGLTVLTGETGAGKSMLLDSLALALGARSDSGLIRKNCEQASVDMRIRLDEIVSLKQLLSAHGIEVLAGEDLLIRRIINRESPSRAWVQDMAVTVGFLRELGHRLVDIQGQFEQSHLLDSDRHRDLFDSFAKCNEKKRQVTTLYHHHQEAREQLKLAQEQAETAAKDADFTKHASAELDALQPQKGEETKLDADRALQTNAEKLQTAIHSAINALDGTNLLASDSPAPNINNDNQERSNFGGAENLIEKAINQLSRHSSLAADSIAPIISNLENALSEAREALDKLRQAGEKTRGDASSLQAIEERLFALRAVARKHRTECDQLQELAITMHKRLELLEDNSAELQRLQEVADKNYNEYNNAAQELSRERYDAKASFEEKVNAILPSIKLEQARFEVDIESTAPSRTGLEKICFKIATIEGYKADKLNKVASAGELSRVLLAISVTLADSGLADCLIFDEVDSGIGGATASAVAKQLRRLAQSRQILVITHSPQVAAWGEQQFRVEKQNLSQDASTTTRVVELNTQSRLEEIARMLAGDCITTQAREAARSLMDAADNENQNLHNDEA